MNNLFAQETVKELQELKYLHLISEAMALPSLKRSPKNSSLHTIENSEVAIFKELLLGKKLEKINLNIYTICTIICTYFRGVHKCKP